MPLPDPGERAVPGRQGVGRRLLLGLAALIILANLAFAVQLVVARRTRFTLAPGATVSDLYPRWLGTRASLFHGQNPYTHQETRRNEAGYYGRSRTPAEAGLDSSGYQGFSYPLYTVFLLAPLALLPFSVVQVGTAIALAVGLVWSALTWCELVGWPSGERGHWLVALVTLFSLPGVDLLSLQQLTGLEIVLIALIARCLARGQLARAGVLLALATIKPQLVALLILGLLTWAARDLPRRRRFVAGFGVTTAALVAAAFALLPAWLAWFLGQTRLYAADNQLNSPLTILFPSTVAAIAVGALVVVVALASFGEPPAEIEGARSLAWSIGLAVAATLVLLPAAATYSDTLLLFPIVVLGAAASRRLTRASRILFGSVIAVGVAILIASDLAHGLALIAPTATVPVLEGVVIVGYVLLPVPVFASIAGQLVARRRPTLILQSC